MIFNDVQNFNASLELLNNRYERKDKRFWDYNKYFSFLVRKVNSLDKFSQDKWILDKVFFYTGKYNSKLIENLKWSCHQKIAWLNRMVEKEQHLLDIVSQQKLSHELRRKVNGHIDEIKQNFEKEKGEYISYLQKQERNFEGQKKLFEELGKNPLIEIKPLQLKQREGEVYQKGIDVLLAIDLVHLAHINSYDVAIVLSGDTDLIEAVRLVRKMGKKVIVVSYHTPRNHLMSNISDLMTAGTHFLNLRDFTDKEIFEMSELREKETQK